MSDAHRSDLCRFPTGVTYRTLGTLKIKIYFSITIFIFQYLYYLYSSINGSKYRKIASVPGVPNLSQFITITMVNGGWVIG